MNRCKHTCASRKVSVRSPWAIWRKPLLNIGRKIYTHNKHNNYVRWVCYIILQVKRTGKITCAKQDLNCESVNWTYNFRHTVVWLGLVSLAVHSVGNEVMSTNCQLVRCWRELTDSSTSETFINNDTWSSVNWSYDTRQTHSLPLCRTHRLVWQQQTDEPRHRLTPVMLTWSPGWACLVTSPRQ